MKIKVKLSKQDKEIIRDIIGSRTILSIKKNNKEIWTCNGKKTKESKELKLKAEIKSVSVDDIVNEILSVLFE
jgi:hypothetical protein